MSRDEYGNIDPPECDTSSGVLKRVREIEAQLTEHRVLIDSSECDTYEGLLKRVKLLEQVSNEQTVALKKMSIMFNDVVDVLRGLSR